MITIIDMKINEGLLSADYSWWDNSILEGSLKKENKGILKKSKEISFYDLDEVFYTDNKGNVIGSKPNQDGKNAKCREWAWVLHDYTEGDLATIRSADFIDYLCYGKEVCPKTKRKHAQGYVKFVHAISWERVRQRFVHKNLWCKMKYTYATDLHNIKYCSKGGDFYEQGNRPRDCPRLDKTAIIEKLKNDNDIKALALKDPLFYLQNHSGLPKLNSLFLNDKYSKKLRLNLEVHVIWGQPNSGKSRHVWDNFIDDLYSVEESEDKKLWFDNYMSHKVILIDEFYGWIKYSKMLKLLDIYPLCVWTKGGSAWVCYEKVFIISNKHPKAWYPDLDETQEKALFRRFKTVEFKGESEYYRKYSPDYAEEFANKLPEIEDS